jgi:hypothetical protein
VLERSRHFDRQLAPLAEGRPDETGICLHSSVYTIEATDPPETGNGAATLRRRTASSCEDGLAEAYARELQRTALTLLPPCAKLDLRQHGTEASLLAFCGTLAGDRLAAAEVLNRAHPFRSVRQAGDAAQLDGLFEFQAVVDWNGERNNGLGTAAQFWTAKAITRGGTFFYDRIEGKSPRLVHLRGSLVRWVDVPEGQSNLSERARFEQVWTRDGSEFVIRAITVGPFKRQPPPR